MKWILFASLLANGFLGFKLWEKSQAPPLERTIVEEHPRVITKTKEVVVNVPVEKVKEVIVEKTRPIMVDDGQIEDEARRVDTDREEYLVGTLGMAPTELKKIDQIKKRYMKMYSEVIPDEQRTEITVEQKRRLIELEEARNAEFARAMGEKKWNEFKKFRDEYNHKMSQKQMNEGGVIIPMEL